MPQQLSQPKIHSAMQAILADCPQVESSSLNLTESYRKAMALIATQKVICLPEVLSHQHDVKTDRTGDLISTTAVSVEFRFTAEDDSFLTTRAIGVHTGQDLTVSNTGLLAAQKWALVNALTITINPVKASDLTGTVMTAAGEVQVTTALNLPSKPPGHKQALSDAAKALMDWRKQINELSAEEPGDWDAHRDRLKKLSGLKPEDMTSEFEKFAAIGRSFGVEYDYQRRMFYLAEIPALAENATI